MQKLGSGIRRRAHPHDVPQSSVGVVMNKAFEDRLRMAAQDASKELQREDPNTKRFEGSKLPWRLDTSPTAVQEKDVRLSMQ